MNETDLPLDFDGIGPEPFGLEDSDLIQSHSRIFAAFHHWPSRITRRQTLCAVAAVRDWDRRLGRSVLIHLISQAGQGSLAEVFRQSLPSLEAIAFTNWEAIEEAMRTGLMAYLESLPESRSYLCDVADCALTLNSLPPVDGTPTNDTAIGPWQLRPGVVLRHYAHDAFRLYDRILHQPTELPESSLRRSVSTSYLLFRRPDETNHGVPLPPELASGIERELTSPSPSASVPDDVTAALKQLAKMGLGDRRSPGS